VAEGRTAVVSGYTDASGDAAMNEELAKQRAFAVRDALVTAGVPDDRIELKKPEQLTGSGDPAQARRVEVALQ
jgi:K(+)-stimulated pyrophosphate-energized sodium pump